MNAIARAALVALLVIPAAAEPKAKPAAKPRLTAVIGTQGLYFYQRDLKRYSFLLMLVNDGPAAVEPAKLGSQLILDDKPVDDPLVRDFLATGPKDPKWLRLEPGEHVQFGLRLNLLVDKPGLHRISWKIAGVMSNEVRLMVVRKQD